MSAAKACLWLTKQKGSVARRALFLWSLAGRERDLFHAERDKNTDRQHGHKGKEYRREYMAVGSDDGIMNSRWEMVNGSWVDTLAAGEL